MKQPTQPLEKARDLLGASFILLKRNIKKRALIGAVLIAFCVTAPALLLIRVPLVLLVLFFALTSLAYPVGLALAGYYKLSEYGLAEHFNRRFIELEESAQLLLREPEELNALQRLQQTKVANSLLALEARQPIRQQLPPLQLRNILLISLLVFVVLLVGIYYFSSLNSTVHQEIIPSKDISIAASKISLLKTQVLVEPPSYTGIKAYQQSSLDLNVPQGSRIAWSLIFSDESKSYYWVNSEGEYRLLEKSSGPVWSYHRHQDESGIYRLAVDDNGQKVSVGDVYPIQVVRDQGPRLKVIQPATNLVEISESKNNAIFLLEVRATDDYGIQSAEVKVTVAKGSGEAVKFRDKSYAFDSVIKENKTATYQKQWSLAELDMAPGDEAYFQVLAQDTKVPEPQETKSSNVILRWLEDDEEELASEGIQIRFIPEYFRSQRQIIIETEQLIADKNDLTEQSFADKSQDLSGSQSDLKQKFGQYLGDEFGEGPGEHMADSVPTHSDEASTGNAEEGEHHDEAEHSKQASGSDMHGSEHGHDATPAAGHRTVAADKSGASDLIAQFTHEHVTDEVGPMSSYDPKTWMKKAISKMWQAELYLAMAEPEKALPFEYSAYEFLKRARQADRIYVKRLGFEPPPVTEERRLTGELEDILSYALALDDIADKNSDAALITRVLKVLSRLPKDTPLGQAARADLQQLKKHLLALSETRPALLLSVTTLEKILLQSSLKIEQCNECIIKLKRKLWQLAPQPISLPAVPARQSEMTPESIVEYRRLVEQIKARSAQPSASGVSGD